MILSRVALLAVVLAPSTAVAGPPAAATPLDATLRQLEKQISAVRELAYKKPVVGKVIPRPADADRHTQGYYSPTEKALYVYDDVKGNYVRGVLIHEMVHALQDQQFGLGKLHQQTFNSDSELAYAALVEGDATYTMIEVLKQEQPKAGAMLDVPLAKAKNLRNAFLYAQGARFVKALKERGGWKAVNDAYRFPPRATATILHPGAGISPVTLGPGKTIGEYGLLAKLLACPETAPLAEKAAAGWCGDRSGATGAEKFWEILFATEADAREAQDALAKLRKTQEPGLKPLYHQAGADTWIDAKGAVHAVLAHGDRVLVLDAPTEAAYRALRERLEAPPRLRIFAVKDKKPLTSGELIDRLLAADLICIGEEHDSAPNHRVQYEIIKGLFARDERLGVGMEMFQRPFQPVVDRFLRGDVGEAEFLKGSEYRQRWGYPWPLYRPIVEFCRRNGLPIAALNAPKELTGRVSKVGYAGLTEAERKQLGPIDFHVQAHRDYWYERLAKMHGRSKVSPERKERSYQVMTIWDDYMAQSAAAFQRERQLRRLVVLAGSGHIERGFGIPRRAAKRTGGKVVTVQVALGGDPKKLLATPVADYLVIVER